jgi:prophage tail gpP-like protein
MMNKVFLEINGIKYEGWKSVSISKSIENLSGQFSFTSSVNELFINNERFIENPIKAQDEARIFIDDELIISGTVESLDINYDSSSHTINVSGRDKTGDLIDSSIIQNSYKLRDFKVLAETVLKENGYSDIKVINLIDNIKNLPLEEKIETKEGDSIFSFLDRYGKKLQVLLNTNSDGDLIITREGLEDAGGALISTKGNENNNILGANVQINTKDRFRFVEVLSQADNDSFDANSVRQDGSAEDEVIRSPRRIIINSSTTSTSDLLNDLANWNVNLRRAKGLRYNCRVVGYYNDAGLIWKPNTLVQVFDDKCQLNGRFLIQGVSYSKSNQGSFTDLSIVNQGAFSLDVETAVKLTSSNDFASNLIRSA